jgi:hypothetical protein
MLEAMSCNVPVIAQTHHPEVWRSSIINPFNPKKKL